MNGDRVSNNKRPLARKLLIAGVLAILAGVLWIRLEFQQYPAPPGMPLSLNTSATVLSEPMNLPDFTLSIQNGGILSRDTLKGQWSFLFFGYTHCPDVCPTTLTILDKAAEQIFDNAESARFVFISVDPERDNVDILAQYVHYFNPSFIGATGPDNEVLALTRPLGILYERSLQQTSSYSSGYLIDHSAAILLVDPQARLRALISPPHEARIIAEDFHKIVEEFGRD